MLLEKWIMIQLFFAKIFSCDCIYLPNHNDCPYKLFLVVVVVLIIINCFVLQCLVVLLTNNSVVLDLEFSHLFISIAKYLQDIAFPVMLIWNVTVPLVLCSILMCEFWSAISLMVWVILLTVNSSFYEWLDLYLIYFIYFS